MCGPVYSSPLCINGVVHVFSRQGEIVTVRASERFEKLAEKDLASGSGIAIAFASHPADAERVDFFRRAAGTSPR